MTPTATQPVYPTTPLTAAINAILLARPAADYELKRIERAACIVAAGDGSVERLADGRWLVVSSDGHTGYLVDAQARTCSCLDYQKRQLPCKHLISVLLTQHMERAEAEALDPTSEPRECPTCEGTTGCPDCLPDVEWVESAVPQCDDNFYGCYLEDLPRRAEPCGCWCHSKGALCDCCDAAYELARSRRAHPDAVLVRREDCGDVTSALPTCKTCGKQTAKLNQYAECAACVLTYLFPSEDQ